MRQVSRMCNWSGYVLWLRSAFDRVINRPSLVRQIVCLNATRP